MAFCITKQLDLCLVDVDGANNASDDELTFEDNNEFEESFSTCQQTVEDNFDFPNTSACWICNGYYGPNFEEPLCSTCHAFLHNTEPMIELETTTTISDDEDSGNDEPPFKDKTEDNDDDDDDDVDNDAVEDMAVVDIGVDDDINQNGEDDVLDQEDAEDEVDVLQIDHPTVELPGENGDDKNLNQAGSFLQCNLRHQIFNQKPQSSMQAAVQMTLYRPRPSPPRSVSQLVEILSEAHANASEIFLKSSSQSNVKHLLTLPVEIMVMIFSYLDDMSLWKASQVCRQWYNIIAENTCQQMWRKYIKERWPLFQSLTGVQDYLKLYGALMSSCFCRQCLLQMALKIPPRGHSSATRMNFLRNDYCLVNSYAIEGIEAIPLDKQNTYWQASILGPTGSPYEGGKFFYLYTSLKGVKYPMIPPTVRFLTKVLHPNVSRHGDVGMDIFQHNWSLALNVSKVLLSVQSLLTDPYTEVCMEPELGYMYEKNRLRFETLARLWTWKYAMFELLPPK